MEAFDSRQQQMSKSLISTKVGRGSSEDSLGKSENRAVSAKQIIGRSLMDNKMPSMSLKGRSRKRSIHVMQMGFMPEENFYLATDTSSSEMISFEMVGATSKQPCRSQ